MTPSRTTGHFLFGLVKYLVIFSFSGYLADRILRTDAAIFEPIIWLSLPLSILGLFAIFKHISLRIFPNSKK